MSKHKVTTEIVRVTPELAMDWLTKNTSNRPVREYWVTELAARMKRGEWQMNAETVKFSVSGKLLDGQHRLMGVFESEVPCEMLVARGVPDDAFDSIDTGRPRTTGDYLAVRKEPHARTLGGALRYLYHLQGSFGPGGADWHGKISNSQVDNLLQANPNIRQSIEHGMKSRRLLLGPLGVALHCLFSGVNDEKAAEFFELFGTGHNLNEGHPILQLRDRLIERPKGYTIQPMMAAALTIKAWNAYYYNRTLLNLRWRQTGPTPEPFPAIERPEAAEKAKARGKKTVVMSGREAHA